MVNFLPFRKRHDPLGIGILRVLGLALETTYTEGKINLTLD